VYLSKNKIQSGFITCGSNSYHVTSKQKSEIILVLFRSVSYLGQRDLKYRPGRASGIDDVLVKTPDAQMLIPLSFSLH
jgi:VanZ family protein